MRVDQTLEGRMLSQVGYHPFTSMNGELVMLSVTNGNYYNMGQIGGRIWELLSAPIIFEDLLQALQEEYEVDIEICKEQTEHFLQQLIIEKLIKAT